jgi:glycosyltransferase involved in cell wall biosynthesis
MSKPLVSFIMSVYKESEDYLRQSINSMLYQDYENIEIIIVNDFPDRDLSEIINEVCADCSRTITLIDNESNLGLAISLNVAIKNTKGIYIARMDADDISVHDRISVQVQYMEDNNFDLIGGQIEKIDFSGRSLGRSFLPTDSKKLMKIFKYTTAAFHPTWLVKSSVFSEVKYNETFSVAQDYEFLSVLFERGFKISNVPQVVLQYRIQEDSLSIAKSFKQFLAHELVVGQECFDGIKSSRIDFNKIGSHSYLEVNNYQRGFSRFVLLKTNILTNMIPFLYYLCKSKPLRRKISNIINLKLIMKL